MLLAYLCTCLIATAAFAGPTPRRNRDSISVSLVVDSSTLSVHATVTNTGSSCLQLYPPNTLLDPRPTYDFTIDGSEADGPDPTPAFVGQYAKEGKDPATLLAAGALLKLEPGQSHEVTTSLAHRFDFSGSGNGPYQVNVRPVFSALTDDSPHAFVRLVADTTPIVVALKNSASTKRSIPERVVRRQASGPSYSGCTSDQEALVAIAAENAGTGATLASDRMNSLHGMNDDTYTTFFGAYDAGRVDTVTTHFSDIKGDFSSLTYNCQPPDCSSPSTFAYVHADTPTEINLCGAFWNAPQCGVDSKQGTLVHEASHFTVNGGTDDIAYGMEDAQALAIQSPDQAVNNADSHEYYEETTFTGCTGN